MTYYLYHVPGVKIGVTKNIKERVENQQGYIESEYDILMSSDDINTISEWEIKLQKKFGYRVDMKLYSKLKCNQMKINVTEMASYGQHRHAMGYCIWSLYINKKIC